MPRIEVSQRNGAGGSNDGHGIFTDASAASNVDHGGSAYGVAFGDVDNDGDLDLYVGNYGQPNVLLLNDG